MSSLPSINNRNKKADEDSAPDDQTSKPEVPPVPEPVLEPGDSEIQKKYANDFARVAADYEALCLQIIDGKSVDSFALDFLMKIQNIDRKQHGRNLERLKVARESASKLLPAEKLVSLLEKVEAQQKHKRKRMNEIEELIQKLEEEQKQLLTLQSPEEGRLQEHEDAIIAKREQMPNRFVRKMNSELDALRSTETFQKLKTAKEESIKIRQFFRLATFNEYRDERKFPFELAELMESIDPRSVKYPSVGPDFRPLVDPVYFENYMGNQKAKLESLEREIKSLEDALERRREEIHARYDAWIPGVVFE
jgi:hypothetical protein